MGDWPGRGMEIEMSVQESRIIFLSGEDEPMEVSDLGNQFCFSDGKNVNLYLDHDDVLALVRFLLAMKGDD